MNISDICPKLVHPNSNRDARPDWFPVENFHVVLLKMHMGTVVTSTWILLSTLPLTVVKKVIVTTSFTKLTWPEDSERTFQSSSQAVSCVTVLHTR